MDVDFDRERDWWNAKAPQEEEDLGDAAINRALRWREIERHLDGVTSILEAGGGTGAFSIPLAKRGYRVTHLDLSPAMLDIARQKAEGIDNLTFVEANITDMASFEDKSFDLVLAMDGAVSFSGTAAPRAVQECCRVTGKCLILTAFSRAALVPVLAQASIKVLSDLTGAVSAMLDTGQWHQYDFPENAELTKGVTQDYFGPLKGFHMDELKALLEAGGLTVRRLGGLGSLSWLTIGERPDLTEIVLKDEKLLERFVDLCERFDLEILPDGPGTRFRNGMIAVAERPK